ncbi:3-oxoacyl-ACP reductase FabG [Streptosporangiaceae bacterium NEAU-GS5]|nr:3-oxoacyl-ACP reductase FabG [Streptosporangiaceae bacterium NEAU-GS5]
MAHAAIVTGASSGIGLAITRTLAGRGDRVYVCARDKTRLNDTVERLRADGLDVSGSPCDVRDPAQIKELVAAAVETYGPTQILVNNVGRTGGGYLHELPDELWFDVIATNLHSVFLLTREVLTAGGMLGSGWGRIVNIASTAGKQGVMYASPYSASKHGVVGFTKAIAHELAPRDITVNAVCPGYVETPMAEQVLQGYATHWGITEDEVRAKFNAKIPLGRYSTADEVAGLVGYLTGDAAASITAQAMNVCGGLGTY